MCLCSIIGCAVVLVGGARLVARWFARHAVDNRRLELHRTTPLTQRLLVAFCATKRSRICHKRVGSQVQSSGGGASVTPSDVVDEALRFVAILVQRAPSAAASLTQVRSSIHLHFLALVYLNKKNPQICSRSLTVSNSARFGFLTTQPFCTLAAKNPKTQKSYFARVIMRPLLRNDPISYTSCTSLSMLVSFGFVFAVVLSIFIIAFAVNSLCNGDHKRVDCASGSDVKQQRLSWKVCG